MLKVGDFIDHKDTLGNWCLAYITEINVERYEVGYKYHNWGATYDVTDEKFDEKTLRPVRSKTLNKIYTGAQNSASSNNFS